MYSIVFNTNLHLGGDFDQKIKNNRKRRQLCRKSPELPWRNVSPIPFKTKTNVYLRDYAGNSPHQRWDLHLQVSLSLYIPTEKCRLHRRAEPRGGKKPDTNLLPYH